MRKLLFGIMVVCILIVSFLFSNSADAHRSGCHRWHSCPSDSGSYTCGDAGHPCLYPTYPASGGVIYPPSGYYKDCYDCPLKKVPSNASTSSSGIGWSCNTGYKKVSDLCVKDVLPIKPLLTTKITPKVLGASTSKDNPLGLQSGWLVKSGKYNDVFYVNEDLCLQWVVNEKAAEKYFGKFWFQRINTYDQFAGYKFCDNLN